MFRSPTAVLAGKTKHRPRILIGKDTRVSGDMLESALAAGLCSVGANVELLGVVPTPAVAYLVRRYGADAGVVISASHNPVEFNGIKLFGGEGYKLPDEVEDEIESHIFDGGARLSLCTGTDIGTVSVCKTALADYVDFVKKAVGAPLTGLRVAIDCANGAACESAAALFPALGAECRFLGDRPDGGNINAGCGSTHLDRLAQFVRENGLDCGVAFDGDADRCLAVDETGSEIDGDKIIAILAQKLRADGRLPEDTAVVTVMSNMGFLEYMKENGMRTAITAVGDRYVLEEMRDKGYAIGGEQSGHIILLELATPADGGHAAARAGAKGLPHERAERRVHAVPAGDFECRGDERGEGAVQGGRVHRGLCGKPAAEPDGHGPRARARLRHRAADPRDGGGTRRGGHRPQRPAHRDED